MEFCKKEENFNKVIIFVKVLTLHAFLEIVKEHWNAGMMVLDDLCKICTLVASGALYADLKGGHSATSLRLNVAMGLSTLLQSYPVSAPTIGKVRAYWMMTMNKMNEGRILGRSLGMRRWRKRKRSF